jgi:hypothetical protein
VFRFLRQLAEIAVSDIARFEVKTTIDAADHKNAGLDHLHLDLVVTGLLFPPVALVVNVPGDEVKIIEGAKALIAYSASVVVVDMPLEEPAVSETIRALRKRGFIPRAIKDSPDKKTTQMMFQRSLWAS